MTFSATSIPEKDAPTAVRWNIVALLMGGSFLSWFNRVSMSVAGTERIMKQYGISETKMGLVYSALLLAYAVCMTPGGLLIDRKGPWAALVLVGIGSGLSVLAIGAVGWLFVSAWAVWLALLIVRAVVGTFMAPIYPASARIIGHWLPLPRRAWANGLVAAAAPAGIACTYFGFGTLIDLFDWPTAFAVTGGITVFVGLLWLLYARDYPEQHAGVNGAERAVIVEASEERPALPELGQRWAEKDRQAMRRRGLVQAWRTSLRTFNERIFSGQPVALGVEKVPAGRPNRNWLSLLQNRSLVLLTLSYAAIGYFEYLFFFWTQYYFDDVLKLGKDTSRLYSTILFVSMAVGIGLGGMLSDRLLRAWGYRWGRAAVPIGGMLASAALLLVGISVSEPIVIVVCFALALASVGACEGPCWATAIELGERRGGTAAGIFNTGGNVGGMIAPVLTPLVSRQWGWGWGIALGSLVCLLGVGLWLGIDAGERVPEMDEPRVKA
jgi:MFS family permease